LADSARRGTDPAGGRADRVGGARRGGVARIGGPRRDTRECPGAM